MANTIEVVCANCGQTFSVGEDLAGQSTMCPHCEGQVAVPATQPHASERPRLQVRRGTPVAGEKACPSCGAVMASDAVICVHCGFDTRTGVTWQKRSLRKNIVGRGLAAVGVLIVLGWLQLWLKARHESGPMGDLPPAVTTQVPPAIASLPANAPAGAPVAPPSTQSEAVVVTAPSNMTPPETTPPPSSVAAVPRASREDLERQITQALNARYPMYARGAQAVLRQNNGLVHRGEILALGTNSVALKTEWGIREIDFAALDVESRLRCDSGARARFVRLRVEKMLSAPSALR